MVHQVVVVEPHFVREALEVLGGLSERQGLPWREGDLVELKVAVLDAPKDSRRLLALRLALLFEHFHSLRLLLSDENASLRGRGPTHPRFALRERRCLRGGWSGCLLLVIELDAGVDFREDSIELAGQLLLIVEEVASHSILPLIRQSRRIVLSHECIEANLFRPLLQLVQAILQIRHLEGVLPPQLLSFVLVALRPHLLQLPSLLLTGCGPCRACRT